MTTRDITDTFREMYGAEVSPSLISKVTEAVWDTVQALQPCAGRSAYNLARHWVGITERKRDTMVQALVVLSGGQDSTTCLYWAIARFGLAQVDTLSFDYGQRHRIELDCARQVAALAGVPNTVLPINTFAALAGNALIDPTVAVTRNSDLDTRLPNTFVPGRNLIFLTFAAAYAYQKGIHHLVTGTAQTDYSGYPDCREATLKALEQAIRLGMDFELALHAPLMFKSKRETVELAQSLGALTALAYTHTCYEGYQPPCGRCPACVLRAKGFAEAGLVDPLLERLSGYTTWKVSD